MQMNDNKTKYLIMKQETTIDEPHSKFNTKTKIYKLERVHLFKYPAMTKKSWIWRK
jgi:hypothetical protein